MRRGEKKLPTLAEARMILDRKGLRLKVEHLHHHSDPDGERRRRWLVNHLRYPDVHRMYLTVAAVVDEDGVPVNHAVSICNPKDQPNRRRGYDMATGRLIANLRKEGVI